jgi:hypothetical protein
VQEYANDSELSLLTIEDFQKHPIIRVEYEQAIAIGGIGETLRATKSKHWGDGPFITPLQPDDWFYPNRITYIYRENSLFKRRFEQRKRMKELLGKKHRPLVETAKRSTKKIFLKFLTDEQSKAIQRILDIESGIFWRMAKGRAFHALHHAKYNLNCRLKMTSEYFFYVTSESRPKPYCLQVSVMGEQSRRETTCVEQHDAHASQSRGDRQW